MWVAIDIFVQKFVMLLNLRLGINAAARVIEIDMLACIESEVICFAKHIKRFCFFVRWILFEKGFEFV